MISTLIKVAGSSFRGDLQMSFEVRKGRGTPRTDGRDYFCRRAATKM